MTEFGSIGIGNRGNIPLLVDIPAGAVEVETLFVMGDDEDEPLFDDEMNYLEVYNVSTTN